MDGTTELIEADRRFLVHPLHHPDDHRQPLVVVEGKGAILRDAEGREYIDGLSGLWNVNVGHGRGELDEAAGVTMAAMSATGMAAFHKMFGPLGPGFIQVPPPYAYRWTGNEEPGVGAADSIEKAILAEGPDTVAAVIAEPVMGAGGVIVPPPSYFPRLREICDRHDVLLIADEVITGFGRTGKWFALGHWGIEPDLVSFAKGVTSGYLPLGGVIASKRVHEAIESAPADRKFMHAATYSGHPVCCAVGLRNVEIIESEGLVERAAVMGRRLLAELEELRDLPVVGDVRGLGMMCGVELVTDRNTRAPALGLGAGITREALARGLLPRIRPGGADPPVGDTICLAPPLMTPTEVLDRIPQILREAIAAATRELRGAYRATFGITPPDRLA